MADAIDIDESAGVVKPYMIATGKTLSLRQAPNNFWSRLVDVRSFMLATRGLAEAVKALLHPSIIDNRELLDISNDLVGIHARFNNKLNWNWVIRTFKTRVKFYMDEVRYNIAKKLPKPSPLNQWTGKSKERLHELIDHAKISFRSDLNR